MTTFLMALGFFFPVSIIIFLVVASMLLDGNEP